MCIRIFTTLFLAFTSASASAQYVYGKVSMEMLSRSTRKGLVNTIKATVYYTAAGKMVSHYYEPTELLITNNKNGDISVYNFKDNTISQKQNFMLGTDQNQLFYFLENNKTDLGLTKMGFLLKETRFEDGLKISVWIPPLNLVRQISRVELVHEKNNPIFLGYFDIKGRVIKKNYFYDYRQVASVSFPTNVTQITFENAKDSIISKVSYSGFKLDNEVSEEYLNFKIPDNAKTVMN